MATLLDELRALEERALAALEQAADQSQLEAWRGEYLGRRGQLSSVMRGLGSLPAAERPTAGAAANRLKQALETAFAARAAALQEAAAAAQEEAEQIDVTLPGRPPAIGQAHPVTLILAEIQDLFQRIGFQVVEGPEVEWDRYNFTLLNIPPDHPARDMWDTFYVANVGRPGETLLRTHTSPVQMRVMEATRPPVRIIAPGRCYRYEATDARHESQFFQVEGLAVDRGITMADLKGVLTYMVRELFGPQRELRFHCAYFPFVEPGAEVAMTCHICDGSGCRVCSQSGWIEVLGAGMVHPQVLKNAGYDPDLYSGFAFGMGPERLAMLKYGIDDIRLFYGNDLRFLRQFR